MIDSCGTVHYLTLSSVVQLSSTADICKPFKGEVKWLFHVNIETLVSCTDHRHLTYLVLEQSKTKIKQTNTQMNRKKTQCD